MNYYINNRLKNYKNLLRIIYKPYNSSKKENNRIFNRIKVNNKQ